MNPTQLIEWANYQKKSIDLIKFSQNLLVKKFSDDIDNCHSYIFYVKDKQRHDIVTLLDELKKNEDVSAFVRRVHVRVLANEPFTINQNSDLIMNFGVNSGDNGDMQFSMKAKISSNYDITQPAELIETTIDRNDLLKLCISPITNQYVNVIYKIQSTKYEYINLCYDEVYLQSSLRRYLGQNVWYAKYGDIDVDIYAGMWFKRSSDTLPKQPLQPLQ